MKMLGNFIMIATVLFMGSLVTVHSQGLEYGYICNNTTLPCFSSNINDPLECSSKDQTNGKCICPSDMFRHDQLNRCVSPHNKTCTLQSGEGLSIRKCTEFAQCWPIEEEGSSTNVHVDGICHCDRDAKFDSLTSKCKLDYGSNRCEKETQCDVRSLFTCREGQCVCQDEDHQVYSEAEGKCVVLAGGSCERVPPFMTPQCAANMDCDGTTKFCKCKDGFTQTPDRLCGKGFDQECSDDSDCHPNFNCRREQDDSPKKCVCREGQEYHNGTLKCLILADQACGTDELSGFECTFKATCDKERCVCETGYEASGDHKCVALYGSECPSDEGINCKDADYLICGENSTCICKDSYVGDDTNKKCRGLIGQNCRNNNNEDCIANSVCLTSQCGCGEKQVENQDKNLCLAVLGGDCGMETPFSDAHFVSCSEGVCNCKNDDDQLPDEENSRCVAKADKPCGAGPAEGIPCVANSTCSTEELVCRCDDSLVNDGQGICVARQSDDSGSATALVSGSLLAAVALVMVMM